LLRCDLESRTAFATRLEHDVIEIAIMLWLFSLSMVSAQRRSAFVRLKGNRFHPRNRCGAGDFRIMLSRKAFRAEIMRQ
jgi:hypothetical protein